MKFQDFINREFWHVVDYDTGEILPFSVVTGRLWEEDNSKNKVDSDGKCMMKIIGYHVSNSTQYLTKLFFISLFFLIANQCFLPGVSLKSCSLNCQIVLLI